MQKKIKKFLFRLESEPDVNNFRYIDIIGSFRDARTSIRMSSYCVRNQFLKSSLLTIGGSVRTNLNRHQSYIRFGGGTSDSLRYMKKYDKDYENVPYLCSMSIRTLARKLGFKRGELRAMNVVDVMPYIRWNDNANPGPSFKSLGYEDKLDAYLDSVTLATECETRLRLGQFVSPPIYGIGGRPKLTDLKKVVNNLLEEEAAGRAVAMADAHEAILCSKFSVPFLRAIKEKKSVIAMGFNRYSDDVGELISRHRSGNMFVNLDWSKFDTCVSPKLIEKVFNLFRYIFHRDDIKLDNPILCWLCDEITNTIYKWKGTTAIQVNGGIPSGSGLTSIIGSVVNALVCLDFLESRLSLGKGYSYELSVSGDDGFLSLSIRGNSNDRIEAARMFMYELSCFAESRYGMNLSWKDCHYAPHLYVGYATPKIPISIADGSSIEMRRYFKQERERLKRPLRFNEKWRMLDEEPVAEMVGGTTHRWTYVFFKSAKFLSFYFHRDGYMIRPTFEVMTRLLNPERKVSSIEKHKDMLLCSLVENVFNKHTVNHIMHLMYDATWLEKLGISNHNLAYKNVRLLSEQPDPMGEQERRTLPKVIKDDVRAWYRRQTDVVNLETDWRTSLFMKRFNVILMKLKRTYMMESVYGEEFYRIRRQVNGTARGLTKVLLTHQFVESKAIHYWRNLKRTIYGNTSLDTIKIPHLVLPRTELVSANNKRLIIGGHGIGMNSNIKRRRMF